MIPPPSALLGFPNDASELSLNYPSLSLFQPTGITIYALVFFPLLTQIWYSLA